MSAAMHMTMHLQALQQHNAVPHIIKVHAQPCSHVTLGTIPALIWILWTQSTYTNFATPGLHCQASTVPQGEAHLSICRRRGPGRHLRQLLLLT